MVFRSVVYVMLMMVVLSGCATRSSVPATSTTGIPLQEICARYRVNWQWDGVSQVVLLEYKGNKSKGLVGSSTVLIGQKQIVLSAPLRREKSIIYVPEDFEAKVLAPFGVPIAGLPGVVSSSKIRTVIIDAGHGGKDRGTSASFGMTEKEIVLDIVKRLKMLLDEAGIKVIMTRDTDEFITLPQRTVIASRSQADLFVSVHVNSNPDRNVSGLLVYYLQALTKKELSETQRKDNVRTFVQSLDAKDSPVVRGIVSDMVNNIKTPQSQRLAKLIVKEARRESGVKVRGDGLRFCHFYVVRNTLIPAVLVETGFISNRAERNKLFTPVYRQKMADIMARAILSYANE